MGEYHCSGGQHLSRPDERGEKRSGRVYYVSEGSYRLHNIMLQSTNKHRKTRDEEYEEEHFGFIGASAETRRMTRTHTRE
jgi:hypothetical protein